MKQGATSDAEQAQLRVSQDQDQISSLEEKIRSATVISPIDGTLYSLPVRMGDYVKVGDELADMADLHKVRVRVFVDEPDMGMLAEGETVQVSWDALPEESGLAKQKRSPNRWRSANYAAWPSSFVRWTTASSICCRRRTWT